jgi:hypothetical protein
MIKLTEKEYKQHENMKNKKIKEELDSVISNHKKEYDMFTHKFLTKYTELKKERALKFEELLKRYKNKQNDLENSQKIEIKVLDKPNKNIFSKLPRNSQFGNNI